MGNGNSKWKVERLPLRERTKQMKSGRKKVAVFVRVKGRRDQPWTITLETVKKKEWPWQPKFYVIQSILFKSITKNKVFKKLMKERKKKKEKKVLDFYIN